VNGKWQALDARSLYRMTVAASELYNTGWRRSCTPGSGSSSRSARTPWASASRSGRSRASRRGCWPTSPGAGSDIEAEYQRLVAEFRAAHGRDPSLAAAHELAQQATLATRKGKKPPRAWSAMRAEWQAELAEEFGPEALAEVMAVVPERGARMPKAVTSGQVDVADRGRVVAEVQEHHATWTRWSVLAQAQRELRVVRFTSPAEQERAVDRVVDRGAVGVVAARPSRRNWWPNRRRCAARTGSSVFTQHGAERYTSQAILDAEARLVDAAGYATTVGVDGQTTADGAGRARAAHRRRSTPDSGRW
jgi:hypothetical protein